MPKSGQDIVCAAVSALDHQLLCNSLEKFTEEQISKRKRMRDMYPSILQRNPNTERGKLLMDSLILGLTEIGDIDYNNRYLTVRVKEV